MPPIAGATDHQAVHVGAFGESCEQFSETARAGGVGREERRLQRGIGDGFLGREWFVAEGLGQRDNQVLVGGITWTDATTARGRLEFLAHDGTDLFEQCGIYWRSRGRGRTNGTTRGAGVIGRRSITSSIRVRRRSLGSVRRAAAARPSLWICAGSK